ncbi:predicted protein [Chaetoceros tenuissimus]|uniref:Uncharacterized protein n=1 Tax=Chaetoceros tenuissimus TaxID=426638 RepID=A0AAD3CDQ4_9STRA|nr:predicted protein [Chaetoceros tenuissimus]
MIFNRLSISVLLATTNYYLSPSFVHGEPLSIDKRQMNESCRFSIATEDQSISQESRPVDLSGLVKECDFAKLIRVDTTGGQKIFKNMQVPNIHGFYGEADDGSSLQYIRFEDDTIYGTLRNMEDVTMTEISVDHEGNGVVKTTKIGDFLPD